MPCDQPPGGRAGRGPGPVDVRAGDRLVRHVMCSGPHGRPDAASAVYLVEGEQVRDAGSLDRRGDAGDLAGGTGRGQRHAVRIRPGAEVVDRVGVVVLGTRHMQARLVVGQHRLGRRGQRRLRRLVSGPARIADRDASLDVAVVIGLKGDLVPDARVVRAALVVERKRLPRMGEEHGVQVLAHVLQAADGEVLLGHHVGIGGVW